LTRVELEQLKSLKQEAKQLQEELNNLPFVPASVKGSMAEFPYIETTFKVSGIDEKKGKQVKEKLDRVLDEIQDQILIMEEWLESVEDSEIRTILRMKYRNGMKNKEIAAELGYSKSAITMKMSRFFEVMQV
jgi:thiamine biosynthesis lipoprotein ApbE